MGFRTANQSALFQHSEAMELKNLFMTAAHHEDDGIA